MPMPDARGNADRDRAIVIVGALPPPMNGYAVITSRIVALASTKRRVICFDISPRRAERGFKYHFSRVWRVLIALACLFPARIGGARDLYIAAESRGGLLYTIALAIVGTLLGFRLFVHHHVFRYIRVRSPLMALLVSATRRSATHIFLCRCMEKGFRDQYGSYVSPAILTNAFIAPPWPHPDERRTGPVTVGLLSNLTREKGLYDFLRLADIAHDLGLAVRFVLAGPAHKPADAKAIAAMQDRLERTFEYRGALYGEDKDRFYGEVDIFVLPTSYENEAQPLVIYEAMAAGALVIASDRGCIAEQVGDAGIAVAEGGDFVREAVARIAAFAQDRPMLESARMESVLHFREEHTESVGEVHAILDIDAVDEPSERFAPAA
jgi:glycosyltransferase involved in cell wall biosynthesis